MKRPKQLEETIIDTFTRLSPAIEVRQNFRGRDVVNTLERVSRALGCPQTIRLDNGPEFISKELDLWAFVRSVTLDFSRPGKPTDNAFIESLNGKFRAECLNANRFLSLDEARRKCEAWRRDCFSHFTGSSEISLSHGKRAISSIAEGATTCASSSPLRDPSLTLCGWLSPKAPSQTPAGRTGAATKVGGKSTTRSDRTARSATKYPQCFTG
jgi:putative transposase